MRKTACTHIITIYVVHRAYYRRVSLSLSFSSHNKSTHWNWFAQVTRVWLCAFMFVCTPKLRRRQPSEGRRAMIGFKWKCQVSARSTSIWDWFPVARIRDVQVLAAHPSRVSVPNKYAHSLFVCVVCMRSPSTSIDFLVNNVRNIDGELFPFRPIRICMCVSTIRTVNQ